jgi:hypothetical protein
MKPLSEVIMRSGLVDDDALSEFTRWGIPHQPPPEELKVQDLDVLVDLLREAMESGDLVEIHTTDLDALKLWLSFNNGMLPGEGRLFLKNGDNSNWGKCSYVQNINGEYLFPWNSDDITDLLTNGESCLVLADKTKVFFESARELYYGDKKCFVACAPRKV